MSGWEKEIGAMTLLVGDLDRSKASTALPQWQAQPVPGLGVLRAGAGVPAHVLVVGADDPGASLPR
jgi:hypothetical protein